MSSKKRRERNVNQLYENVVRAVEELPFDCKISKVEKLADITAKGVMITPALAIDGKVVSSGKVLNTAQIKEVIANSNRQDS